MKIQDLPTLEALTYGYLYGIDTTLENKYFSVMEKITDDIRKVPFATRPSKVLPIIESHLGPYSSVNSLLYLITLQNLVNLKLIDNYKSYL